VQQRDGTTNGTDCRALRFYHDAWGQLVLEDGQGQRHVGVEPIRCFPLSDPRGAVSVCDAAGREVLWLESLDVLPAAAREVLEEDFAHREFLPMIHRIVRISTLVEPSEWQVETDRGPTRFVLNNEDDVHRLGEHRAMVIDAHGIRYLIADTRALDAASRRGLERYL
jgi:hypothetical protein